MRILIACDHEEEGRRVAEVLAACGPESPSAQIVPLELAADRASRLVPELLVIVLPEEPEAGLGPLRETCNTVRGTHVLVVGPATDAKFVLSTLHQGADEYLDQGNLETDLTGALVRLKLRQAVPENPSEAGKVIACLGPSGGSGTSTIAANLGIVLAGKGKECGLVDLRLAAGDLASVLGLKPRYTLADVCDRLDRMDQSMFEQFFVRHASGVHLLAAPHEFGQIPKVSSQAVRRTLALARVRFPYVVVDLDNAFSGEQVEALWQSDVILLVLRLDYTSVRNVRLAMDHMAELGIGLERVRLVANFYGESRQLGARQAEEALGMRIAHYVPSDPARVNSAVNRGVPVVTQKPSAKISRSLRDLAASLNGVYPGA